MYIVLTNDGKLYITQPETIYRGDNLNKRITFLLPKMVGDIDMMNATVFLSYIRPDGHGDMVLLEKEAAMHKQSHYQYIIPVTCKLSRYPGNVCMWLQICTGDPVRPTVSKTGECNICIQNSQSMDDCLGDHQLTALYQMQIKLDAMGDGNGSSGETGDDEWSDMDSPSNPGDDADVWEDM